MTRSAKGCGGDAFPGVIDSTSDVGPDSNDDPDLPGDDPFSVDFGNTFGDDDDDEHPGGTAGEHALSINAISGDFGELGADLSPWAPLLGMLDSTEPEASRTTTATSSPAKTRSRSTGCSTSTPATVSCTSPTRSS